MSVVFLFPLLLGIGFLVITVMVIVNIINNSDIDSNNKLFWIILILVTNVIGLIVYFVVDDKNIIK
ncbi:MAG: hypothetical protein KQ78_00969 [Candidatus Izimaplasma bacterium HR2]|nr:MAG: hypothetical protein KQ78_00969 [Candidatus Izimaplasma bacterium HR2]